MFRKLLRLRAHFLSRSFVLFLVIGSISTFDTALFAKVLVLLGGGVQLSYALSYILSNFVAYELNRRFSFPSAFSLQAAVRFFVSYLPNFLIENTAVFVLYEIMGLPDIVAFLLAAAVAVPVTFLLVKLFAFKRSASVG